jgi:hypothetical protein
MHTFVADVADHHLESTYVSSNRLEEYNYVVDHNEDHKIIDDQVIKRYMLMREYWETFFVYS